MHSFDKGRWVFAVLFAFAATTALIAIIADQSSKYASDFLLAKLSTHPKPQHKIVQKFAGKLMSTRLGEHQSHVTDSLHTNAKDTFIKFFEFLGKESKSNPKTYKIQIQPTHKSPRVHRERTTKQLYQVSFEQAMKAQHMYAQATNDVSYEGVGTRGHLGRNLQQPQISPAAEPRMRTSPAGQQRSDFYTRTGVGMMGPHPTALARAPPRPQARRPVSSNIARNQGLLLESFETGMRAQEMYDAPSDDGYMPEAGAYGRFGPNLRQRQLSPADGPSGWSLAAGEDRMRRNLRLGDAR
jgi:hypothetical protein